MTPDLEPLPPHPPLSDLCVRVNYWAKRPLASTADNTDGIETVTEVDGSILREVTTLRLRETK